MTDRRDVRARWDAALREAEEHEAATGEHRRRAVAEANRWRRDHGVPDLADESHPELELHARARALGLCR